MSRRATPLVAALALFAPVAAASLAAPAAGARAATAGGPAVRVLLDALGPTSPRPHAVLRIRGRIVNASSHTVPDPRVRLRYSSVRLTSRAELDAVATGRETRDTRSVPQGQLAPGDLAPGAVRSFDLRVPLDDVPGLGEFGVYPLAVEVRAGGSQVGFTSTFLTWTPDPPQIKPAPLVWLWPLVDLPRRVGATFVDDTLATSLAPGGRLGGLVAAARGRAVTWVVDPMLLDDARDMSGGGYSVNGRPGTGDAAARSFLGQLRSELRPAASTVVALPYGDPDSVAERRAGAAAFLRAAMTLGQDHAATVLGRPVIGTVALPPGGVADRATARLYAADGATSIVLRDDVLPPAEDPGYTLSAATSLPLGKGATMPALLVDHVLSSLAAADTRAPGAQVLAQQRFLAETALVTAERPGVARTLVIEPPARWAPTPSYAWALVALTTTAPWLSPVPLAQPLAEAAAQPLPEAAAGGPASAPPVPRATLSYPPAAASAELTKSYLQQVAAVARSLRTTATVLSNPGPVLASYATQQLRLRSSGLRAYPALRGGLLHRTERSVRAQTAAVHVLRTRLTLGSRSGQLPVTVVNDLTDQDVTVRLSLTSDSPRLTILTSRPVTISAGQRRLVEVRAHAVANGVTLVRAQLVTADGTPIGTALTIPVRVAQYGVVGVVVAAGAALLLFLAAGRQIVRRARGLAPPDEDHADPVLLPDLAEAPTALDATAPPLPTGPATAAGRPRGRHAG